MEECFLYRCKNSSRLTDFAQSRIQFFICDTAWWVVYCLQHCELPLIAFPVSSAWTANGVQLVDSTLKNAWQTSWFRFIPVWDVDCNIFRIQVQLRDRLLRKNNWRYNISLDCSFMHNFPKLWHFSRMSLRNDKTTKTFCCFYQCQMRISQSLFSSSYCLGPLRQSCELHLKARTHC